MTPRFIAANVAIFLTSCSSVTSIESPANGETAEGLAYYMPQRDFSVTVTIDEKRKTTVALGTTNPYPDLSTRYVLRHGSNLVGQNSLDVGINSSGLLQSATSKTVTQIDQALRGLASAVGSIGALNFKAFTGSGDCAVGSHTFVFLDKDFPTTAPTTEPRTARKQPCGLSISLTNLDQGAYLSVNHTREPGKRHSGFYYRQNIPYLMTASSDNGIHAAAVVYSPNKSPTYFLPAARTVFANNEAVFAFEEGVPTRYKQDTDGEIVGVLSLPAAVISAYFGAVGSVFDSFKTTDEKESSALGQSLSLTLMQQKYEACIAAIKAGDDTLVEELGCNK